MTSTQPRHNSLSGSNIAAGHIPALDGIRAIAIIVVAFSHFRTVFGQEAPYHDRVFSDLLFRFFEFGWFGVDLFFALSGFLITGILLDSVDRADYFGRFYWRRFLRIFPVYYAFLFCMLGVLAHLMRPNPWPGLNAWWYIGYLVNWKPDHGSTDRLIGHAWSLAVEEQFYLFWPAVVLWLPRKTLGRVCLGLAALALILRVWLVLINADIEAIVRITPTRMDPLVLGSLMALVLREPDAYVELLRWRKHIMAVCAAVVVGIIAFTRGANYDSVPMHTVGMTALAVFFAFTILEAARLKQGTLRKLLTNSSLRNIGKYSYTMYLIHIPLHRILYVPVKNALAGKPDGMVWTVNALYLIVICLVTYGIASLSWHKFERRILSFKDAYPFARSKSVASAHS